MVRRPAHLTHTIVQHLSGPFTGMEGSSLLLSLVRGHHNMISAVRRTPTSQPHQSSNFYSTGNIIDSTWPFSWMWSFALYENTVRGRKNGMAITPVCV